MAQSYERMPPEQQRLFRALGVFAEEALITADAAGQLWGMDDLNTAQALAAVFGLIKEGNIALTEGALEEENRSEILQWFEVVEQRLGIVPTVEALVQVDEKVGSLIAQRNEARRNRDFAKADRIRQQLLDLDVIIEDTREGTKWRRK